MVSDPEEQAEKARKTVRQQRRWGWFWYGNIPPVVISFFVMDHELWQRCSLLYLAMVSIWALGISHHSRAEAAEAVVAGYDNP